MQKLKLRPRGGHPGAGGISVPPDTLGGQLLTGSPRPAGHRQKLEDQTKAFPDLDRVRMRVTPSMPSPRGSLSTTSHFNSQVQTPIQGRRRGGGGGPGPGRHPGAPGPKPIRRPFLPV